jgi:ribosomal protein L24
MPVAISNVAIYNAKTKKADRVGLRIDKDGVPIEPLSLPAIKMTSSFTLILFITTPLAPMKQFS